MATNGLRYGAAIELRENFTGQVSSTASSGASAYSSTETVFVRAHSPMSPAISGGSFGLGKPTEL